MVDNLPPQLVADVVRLVDRSRGPRQPIAVVVDVRSGSFFADLQEVLAKRTTGRRTTLLFLEATDEVLVRRQEAARRPHPLQDGGRLLDGLHREREVLADVRADADLVIDTTGLNVHQLTATVARAFGTEQTMSLKATVVSFGFKYGIPVDADLVADMRFLPNPYWVPELRPLHRPRRGGGRLRQGPARGAGVPGPVRPAPRDRQHRLPPRGQALHDGRDRLHRRQAPQRRDDRGDRRPAARAAGSTPARCTATSGGSEMTDTAAAAAQQPAPGWWRSAAATASPRRWRRCAGWSPSVTAVVTVADNGGSSGRLRREFGVLPPGDLRQALAALCGDDDWGRTWANVLQHRFASDGEMDKHAVGNLLIVTLWELLGDHVGGLDWVGRLLGAQGRVLPMAVTPIDITASVVGLDPADPEGVTTVRGQVEVASTNGRVTAVHLEPEDPPACREALAAVDAADWVVLGPGSWFTSVIPHLLVPELRDALVRSPGAHRGGRSTWRRSRGRPTASRPSSTSRC